jgi:hypothetical protein
MDTLAVHQHRARPALAEAAALLRAREIEMLAKRVEQGGAGIEPQPMLGSIDAKPDIERFGRRIDGLSDGRTATGQ